MSQRRPHTPSAATCAPGRESWQQAAEGACRTRWSGGSRLRRTTAAMESAERTEIRGIQGAAPSRLNRASTA